jgi:hypothetical protein
MVVSRPDSDRTTFRSFAVQNCIATVGAVLLRRKFFEKAKFFDVATAPCDDWDLYFRMSCMGDFACVLEPIIRYRIHGDNVSGNREIMWAAGDRVRVKMRQLLVSVDGGDRILKSANRYFTGEAYRVRVACAIEALARGRLITFAKNLRHASLQYYKYIKGAPP